MSAGHLLSHFYLLTLPPLFPLLVADFDATNAQLGLMVSMIYLATFVFQIPAGEFVDRIGAKRVFVIGVVLSALGTMLIGLATSYLFLLAFAFVAGIGQAAFHPADYALLDAVTADDEEGKSFGVHTFAGFVGFAAAPPIVGTLGLLYGWQTALVIVGAAGLAFGLFAQFAMGPVYLQQVAAADDPGSTVDSSGSVSDDRGYDLEADGSGESEGRFGSLTLLRQPAVLGMFVFFVVVTISDIGIQAFTAIFLVEGFGYEETIGNTTLTLFLAATAIGVLVGGWLADRFDFFIVIVCSLLATSVVFGLTVTPLVDRGPTAAMAIWSTAGFVFGLALPSRDRAINALSDAGDTGKSFGIVYTGLPLGGFVGPVVIGLAIDYVGLFSGFAVNAICFAIAAVIVYVVRST
ncbi:MFS transporter [Natrarchaeobaculum aegyptiacum]|uniref:MFS transporter n=1 Tax=Natrarchaeobaculum aegyptiacum TaxID=745377 RepID=UPI001E65B65C|nr:MFS transporter [Natrarchaeobaculum aegyptiacum]